MKTALAIWFVIVAATWLAHSADSTNSPAANDDLRGMIATITNRWRQQIEAPKEVTLNGNTKAKYVLFCQTRWELKTQGQRFNFREERDAMELSEADRLKVMNRLDDFTEMWFVRLADYPDAGPTLKPALQPGSRSNQYHRELAYLGRTDGFACFAFMPIYEWINLQTPLKCQGGDDPLAAAVRGLSIEDRGSMTANTCSYILAAAGGRAVPYLKPLLSTTNAPGAVRSLIYNKSSEATELLLKCAKSADPDLARLAKHYLSALPRAEAEELYFQWLAEDAGRANVLNLLKACAQFDKPRLAPILPRVLASPTSAHELRLAFELSRSLAGKEIPATLLQAEAIIMRYGSQRENSSNQQEFDKAVVELTQAEDAEAAACIGVSLAVATTKGGLRQANQAGISILKALPDQQGRKMAKVLYDSCDNGDVKRRLKEVVED